MGPWRFVVGWPDTVRKSDLRIDFYRGSGAGGQNRNKRDTACRLTHIPTGLVASAQEHRTQDKNRQTAFLRLADKLVPIMTAKAGKPRAASTVRVRTYHAARGDVIDKRAPGRTFSFEKVLNGGGLSAVIDAVISADSKTFPA